MKPIKTLLSFCVVLMVAMGAWGQVTSITAPAIPAGQQCVGATIVPPSSPTIVASGCAGEAVFLQLFEADGTELAVGSAGSVPGGAAGSVVIPAAALGKTVYYRYVTKGTTAGCAFNGTATPLNNNTVVATPTKPTIVAPIPSICHLETQKTLAEFGAPNVYANCTSGTLTVAYITGTSPWNTAGDYTIGYKCVSGVCESPIETTTFTVKNPLNAPIFVKNIPSICPGEDQLTVEEVEAGGFASCAADPGSVLKVISGPLSNTTSGAVQFICERDGCKSGVYSHSYTIYSATAAPTGVTINGGSSVTACASAIPASLVFGGDCAGNNYKIWNVTTNTLVSAAYTSGSISPIPTSGTTVYRVTCTDATCESTGVEVTYTVSPAIAKPELAAAIPSICHLETQLTEAQLEAPGVYASCAPGTTLNLVSVSGTAPWNTAGTYTAMWRCETSATCYSELTQTTFTVKNPLNAPIFVKNIPSICPGKDQLTVEQVEAGGFASCAADPGSVLKVINGPLSNTTSGAVQFICERDGCKSAVYSHSYTIYSATAAPTGVSITGSRAGATGNGTTAVTVCSSPATAATLAFAGDCAGNNFKIWNVTDNVLVTASYSGPITAPTKTTEYKVSCTDATCESTGVTVTYTVSPAIAKPVLAAAIPSICHLETQKTEAELEAPGVYASCEPGFTLNLVSVSGTAPWNTAGTYTAMWRCESSADCYSELTQTTFIVKNPLSLPIFVKNIPSICPGEKQLTVEEVEAGGFASCAADPGAVLKVINGPLSNTTSGSVQFICERDGCKSGVYSHSYTIYSATAAPTGVNINGGSSVTACASSLPASLTFGGDCAGNNYKIWNVTDNVLVTASYSGPIPVPSKTTVYRVTCTDATCESTGVEVTFTLGSGVAKPTLVKAIPSICHLGTQLTEAQLEAAGVYASCEAGATLNLVSVSGTAPWNTAGTYTAMWRCEVSATCYSELTQTTFIVNSPMATPTLSASATTICAGETVTFTVGHTCPSTATLELYKNDTILVASKAAGTSPATIGYAATTGTYKVKCMFDKCYSAASSGVTVTANALPAAPTFTGATPLQPSAVCANTSVGGVLLNTLTCAVNTQVLVWYDKDNLVVPQPNTQPAATTTWTVSCRNTVGNTCEGPRTTVVFTVNPQGSTPTGVSLTAEGTTVNVGQDKVICSTTGAAITFTGCPSGETMLVSVDGNVYSATIPSVVTDGIKHNYRVRCQAGSGASACDGPESGVMSLTAYPVLTTAPTANVVPAVVCSASAPVAFGGSSSCGALATVWFDATTNTQLLSLPSMTPTTPGTYSYYAKCVNGGGCMSPASATTSLTVVGNSMAPTITSIGGTEVCTGVNVTLTTNCPAGSVVKWSTGDTGNALPLVSAVPQVRAVTAKCAITVGSTTCESPVSATTTVVWKTFDITIINIGSPLSGVKPGSNVPKSAWAANFVTVDAGPSLQSSSQGNPSVFFTENPNKGADRFWTVHVESCALGTTGAISYDMLVTPEAGVPYSYNTVENNAPYLMYANRDGFTELYAHNHGAYGFTSEPKYTQGLPKGLYKLSIRYWSEKGMGLYPAVRTAQGTQLAYQEYWFRIQSQNGIGSGAAREGVTENTEAPFVTMGQNPVTRTLSLTINGAKGQDVKLNLVDASGRSIKVSSVTPETNTHREEIDMTSQNTGMYFIQVSTPSKRASLKVLKVSQD
ncbi:T9SS type A sorting domain-containing protein [Runella sp. SP2]|uniref:T9SS type A sorting domain-containing protein n=1 Tax=Runella sp. SP2 TaxID=2268026 RepID=UPI000F07E403|nr:T9SS type A sorting domain-containing protein [Runella sp. SP2]AYQ30782.1 T9SS C-terminal target domain-containing protein [Runella sp. SP2]